MVGQIGRPNNDLEQPNNDLVVDGDVVVRHRGTLPSPGTRIRLDRETGSIFVHNNEGEIVFHWEMPGNNLRFGGNGRDGDLVIHNQRASDLMDANEAVFHLDSQRGAAIIGGNQSPGQIVCRDADNNQTIFLNGAEGDIRAGANGLDGNIFVQNANNEAMIRLNGDNGRIVSQSLQIRSSAGANSIFLGGENSTMLLGNTLRLDGDAGTVSGGSNGSTGWLTLFPSSANNVQDLLQAGATLNGNGALTLGGRTTSGLITFVTPNVGNTIALRGDESSIRAGGGQGGNLLLFPSSESTSSQSPEATITLFAESGQARIGGGGGSGSVNGSLEIQDRFGNDVILLDSANGTARFGGGVHGQVLVRNSSNETTIELNGESGDIILQNGDCAEDFEVALDVETSPGTVMVVDSDGKLKPSTKPYDKRAAGIVAGGGDLRPGIILGRRSNTANKVPIALFGRTYCKVDATYAAISVGDLLTTSSTPGLAMKATNPEMAFGSVVGKALQSLSSGTGLIQILVALQ